MALVEIADLKVSFRQYGGTIDAVRGISFTVNEGESLGIVGESGSGKSVSCSALLRLLPATAEVSASKLELDGIDVSKARKDDLARLRGRSAAMIFQDPMTAFDPVFTIGHQITETIQAHRNVSKRDALKEAEELLLRVEIKNASDVLNYFPHQLSGGMLQRAMIAMALSCRPKVLIADEPTTALDVTIQAQILDLLADLKRDEGLSMLFISHDLRVVKALAHRLIVMRNGQVIEQGAAAAIFADPQQAYTRQLLAAAFDLAAPSNVTDDRLPPPPTTR